MTETTARKARPTPEELENMLLEKSTMDIAEELGVHVEELIPASVDPIDIALRLAARSSMTEEQKAKFRRVIDGEESV